MMLDHGQHGITLEPGKPEPASKRLRKMLAKLKAEKAPGVRDVLLQQIAVEHVKKKGKG